MKEYFRTFIALLISIPILLMALPMAIVKLAYMKSEIIKTDMDDWIEKNL